MADLTPKFLEFQSHTFQDKEQATFRISSIGYLLLGAYLGEEDVDEVPRDIRVLVEEQVSTLARIARSYQGNEQIAVLKSFERRIDEALEEPRCFISRYASGTTNVDPIRKLAERCSAYNAEFGRFLTPKGLDNATEDTLSGFKTSDHTRMPHHPKKGAERTGS